jgi:hypothetical protein
MLEMLKGVEGQLPPDVAIKQLTQRIMEDATNSANDGPMPKPQLPQQPQSKPQGILQGAMQ